MALAIFDLDNTLISGDSDHGWGEFLVAENKVDAARYKATNDQFYADYEAGKLNINAYLEFSLAPLAVIPTDELQQLHKKFMRDVVSAWQLPKAEVLLRKHRERGDRLLVITSTNRFVVEPICRALGIDEILATEPEIIDQRYTGKFFGTPTYQEGKVIRLNAWLEENNESLCGSWFYSDSINDLPLLLEVDNPVAVDPDNALKEEAISRNWPIISLRE